MKQLLIVALVVTALIAYSSGKKDGALAKKEPGGNKPEAKAPAKSEGKEKLKHFLEALFGGSKKSGDKKSSMPKTACGSSRRGGGSAPGGAAARRHPGSRAHMADRN